MKVAVLGAGAWGTALALLLHRGGHSVVLWGHDPVHLEEMSRSGGNARYLPGVAVPREWRFEPDLLQAVEQAELVVVAVPSQAMRTVAGAISAYRGLLVTVTKGIDFETGFTMGGVLAATLPGARVAALSGPTLALEIAKGIPAAIVAASVDPSVAQRVQQAFHSPLFRVYTSPDPVGVEMGAP